MLGCFFSSNQIYKSLVSPGIDLMIPWSQPGVHTTKITCHESVKTTRLKYVTSVANLPQLKIVPN